MTRSLRALAWMTLAAAVAVLAWPLVTLAVWARGRADRLKPTRPAPVLRLRALSHDEAMDALYWHELHVRAGRARWH